jgi:hypothetical protein
MLTAKVDARRQTFAATQSPLTSSLPRPRRLSSQFTSSLNSSKSSTPLNARRPTIEQRRTLASPGSLEEELQRASSPLTRTFPKRPASRQSSISSVGRPQTPSSSGRSPTPNLYSTFKKPVVARPAFGSGMPSGRLPPSAPSSFDLAARARKASTTSARRQSVKLSTHGSAMHTEEGDDERF